MLQLEQRLQQKPGTLSGGQRQRVAIGRAIVRQPKIFLFDEPLSNLDAALRAEMRVELMSLHKKLGSTMIYVTHDQVEAMTMADKIVVLNAGTHRADRQPARALSPAGQHLRRRLHRQPEDEFPVGNGDRRRTAATSSSISAGSAPSNCRAAAIADLVGKTVTLGMRPEHLALGER